MGTVATGYARTALATIYTVAPIILVFGKIIKGGSSVFYDFQLSSHALTLTVHNLSLTSDQIRLNRIVLAEDDSRADAGTSNRKGLTRGQIFHLKLREVPVSLGFSEMRQ